MGIIVGDNGGQQRLSCQATKVLIKESLGVRTRERMRKLAREREVSMGAIARDNDSNW